MTVSVSTEALEALQALAAEKTRVVMLSVDPETELVQLVPGPPDAHPSTVAEIVQAISPTEPRFTFCRFEHEGAPGRRDTALLFFFTCPSPPPGTVGLQAARKRMVYPLLKRAVLQVARAEAGLSADKRFEVEDTAELDEDLVLGELRAPKEDEPRGD
ncbi:hypothetical protein INS49_005347 [Diaporthe citri]|uniref:uncharacterized protein n=1 Tax=Diaporthe citri TaxID=83186 RepID=UPI001C7E37E2|nr:uncharacterized protein INS49_005347 [Diaporthe citri]KAG6353639.1 hypothetical protein INS49_005347 [Diaporthe citri]